MGTGDEDSYLMADMKNRCAGDDSVVFSHHSPWLIVVCTLSKGPVIHKHAHKHASLNKCACLHSIYSTVDPHIREEESNTSKITQRRERV